MSTVADRPRRARVGSPPKGPTRLHAREWFDVGKRTFKEFLADDAMGLSQEIAYSALLAFFPAVILLIGLLGLFGPDAYNSLIRLLSPVAPNGVIKAIQLAKDSSTGNTGGSVAAVVVGTAGAIWAASGAMGSVVKAVNRAFGRIETRPFWKVRLISLLLVALTGVVLAGTFLLIVFGGPIGDAIAKRAHLGGAFDLVWGIARWPIAFTAVLLFLALVYYLAPNHPHRSWRWISPGSAGAGLLWLALSGLFALYTSFSSSYDRTYGSLAGAIVLLLWLNYSAWAVLFGAELNAELDRQADIHAAGGENAGLVTPARRVRR